MAQTIHAVVATMLASGLTVDEFEVIWPDRDEPRSATIDIRTTDEDGAENVLALRWAENDGWSFEGADGGGGLGAGLTLVADPAAVATAVAYILNGADPDTTPIQPRDSSIPDVTFEMALGAYRTHPGHLAVKASGGPDGGPLRVDTTGVPAADLDAVAAAMIASGLNVT